MHMVRLWRHETYRVYSDRLIEVPDSEKYEEITLRVTKNFFGEYEPDEFDLAYAAIEDDGGSRGVSPHTEDGDTLRPPFAPASALLSLASLV